MCCQVPTKPRTLRGQITANSHSKVKLDTDEWYLTYTFDSVVTIDSWEMNTWSKKTNSSFTYHGNVRQESSWYFHLEQCINDIHIHGDHVVKFILVTGSHFSTRYDRHASNSCHWSTQHLLITKMCYFRLRQSIWTSQKYCQELLCKISLLVPVLFSK